MNARSLVLSSALLALACSGTSGDGDAGEGGGTASSGGGSASTGGGTATSGGGSAATGGGSTANGGGTASTGGGTSATGGGSSSTGGGSSSTGGGSSSTGGGSSSTGGGTAATGGGTSSTGGGSATGGGFVDAGSQGAFVAVGYGGRRIRSTDGTTWTNDQSWITNGGDDNYLLRAVAYGEGKFDSVGWRTTTSVDGETWVDGGLMNQWLGGLAYAKGIWVAAGGYGRRTWSADGVTWHDVNNNDTRAHRQLAYDDVNDRWVAVGDNGLLVSTFDGGSWADGQADSGTMGFGAVGSGGGITIAFAGANGFVSHNGGLTWSGPIQVGSSIDNVAFAEHQFVAIGQGHAFTTMDGVTWTSHTVNNLGGALACHGTLCVAVSDTHAFRSTDEGTTWTPVTYTAGQYVQAAAWGSW